jgi:hypothetical protein
MVDVTPGNLGANKGHWAKQLRDRFSRFMEEGSFVLIEIELPGVYGKVHATGKLIRAVSPGVALVRVETNKEIPAGDYEVSTENITAIQATIPLEHVEKKAAEARGETAPAEAPLKASMSGSEVLKERLRSVARALKEDGRFPIPRLTPTSTVGKTSDIAKGAKLDYKKVFDAEPALQEKYKTFDNMWESVFRYSVDERTKSPNELKNIPEDMKELNRAYAKHVLGLDPEGLITVYRNAINFKATLEESAVGYVSLDRTMAYDYNPRTAQRAANGRYEIDVKPAEVFGMLGYSEVEDEYGVTIGREVTNIPGRVRRVGDLASPEMQAPWLVEIANKYRAVYGASPFRGFNVLSEFDFHPVDPLGETSEEFFQKYNVSAAELKAKFDQLFGEGAYDRYKASGNIVSFQRIRDLFIKLPDGRIGLDASKLEDMGVLAKPEEMVNDLFDNTIKMLSVFQELTGQYFMTHKTRDYVPLAESPKDSPTPVLEDTPPVDTAAETPPTESSPLGTIPSGYENWLPSMADILGFNDDEDSEDDFDPALGNKLLSRVMEKAGYNEKPKILSAEEFNAVEGETMYRAVTDAKFVDQYLNSSKHFAGTGVFGNGTYSTSKRESAEAYAGSTNNDPDEISARLMEMKFSTDANVLSFNSSRDLRKWAEENAAKFKEEYTKFGANPGEIQQFNWQMNNTADWTSIAIMAGYDAIRFRPDIGTEYFTIILNRGKVIAKQPIAEVASPSVIPPGAENWIPALTDILKLTADSDSEDNNFDPELGNKRLSIVMEKAGYNAKPTLVSPEEFDSIEGQTLYRGISDQRFIDQYKNSPKHFAGVGNFGNGTYSSNDRKTAARYGGSDSNVMEIKMASDANIKRFDSRKDYMDWVEETLDKFREEYGNSGVSNEEYYDFVGQMNNVVDWTNVAVMLGIDAVEFPHSFALEERYTIILNRGKVIINDKS